MFIRTKNHSSYTLEKKGDRQMGLMKKHTKPSGILNLLIVFLVTLLLSIGCSSGGGGGDDDDDDNNDGSNPIVGVWALKSTTENCGDAGTTNFPYNFGGMAVVSGYVKLTSNTLKYYIKMADVNSELEPYGYKNGTFSCPGSEEPYTIDGNTIVNEDGTTANYTLSGDTLTIVTIDDEYEDENCTVTLVLEKSSESAIANDQENCDLLELIDY